MEDKKREKKNQPNSNKTKKEEEKQVQWAVNNFPIYLSLSLSFCSTRGETKKQHDWIRTHVVQKKRVTQSCSTTNFFGYKPPQHRQKKYNKGIDSKTRKKIW
jgi:hypothetical protein